MFVPPIVLVALPGTAEESATRDIGPGLIAFAIVALLALATFLLIRSMLHHIRKVPPSFDTPSDDDAPREDGSASAGR